MIKIISSSVVTIVGESLTYQQHLEDLVNRLTAIEKQLESLSSSTDYLEAEDVQELFNQREVICNV